MLDKGHITQQSEIVKDWLKSFPSSYSVFWIPSLGLSFPVSFPNRKGGRKEGRMEDRWEEGWEEERWEARNHGKKGGRKGGKTEGRKGIRKGGRKESFVTTNCLITLGREDDGFSWHTTAFSKPSQSVPGAQPFPLLRRSPLSPGRKQPQCRNTPLPKCSQASGLHSILSFFICRLGCSSQVWEPWEQGVGREVPNTSKHGFRCLFPCHSESISQRHHWIHHKKAIICWLPTVQFSSLFYTYAIPEFRGLCERQALWWMIFILNCSAVSGL